MSVTWGEKPNSIRSTTNPQSVTVTYVLTGVTSRTLANAMALGYSAAIYSGLYRSNVGANRIGPALWEIEITYGPYNKKEPEAGDFKWRFSTGGGTKHITQAKEHINEYDGYAGLLKVDHKGTIGLNENGDVEGVDILDVLFKWQEERRLLLADYGWAYAQVVADITGKVNNATFRGFPAGTVLFEDATGGQSEKDPLFLDVTYSFYYSPNATGLVVGDISGIAKKGHEYLWVEYQTEDPGEGKSKLPKRPSQVNIERVFDEADFSLLGIGTA